MAEQLTLHQAREAAAMELFDREGIVVSGDHFVYAAGGHGDAYVQKDKTLVNPDIFVQTTDWMAEDLEEEVDPEDIDYLVGFAPCSSLYASRMAERLSTDRHTVRSVFMEKVSEIRVKEDGTHYIYQELKFKRGFGDLLIGKRIWVVEDIVTTGSSLIDGRKKIEAIEGAECLGASAAYSRTPQTVTRESLGLNIWLPLIENTLTNYQPGECPMDADLTTYPIRTDLGHGATYLAEHPELRQA